MANIGSLQVFLTANTKKFERSMRKAKRQLKVFGQSAKRLAIGVGAIGVGLGALAVRLSRPFRQLDEKLNESLAIMGKVSSEMRKEMEMTARILSTKVRFSADQLAEGYFFLASAGKDVAQSQRLLGDVATFAQAGMFDLATATTLLADAQKTLGLDSKDVMEDQKSLIRVSDVLVKANTLANANVQQFSEALTNQAGPAMRAFGIDLEEGVAVLSAYAEQGIKGQEAGSMLGRALRLMIPAAVENADAYNKLGISVFNAQGDLNKMSDIANALTDAFKDMSVAERSVALESLGFAKKMQSAIFPLLGAGDAISKYEKELRKAGGTTKQVADNQLKSFNAQWDLFINNMTEGMLKLTKIDVGVGSLKDKLQSINDLMRSGFVEYFINESIFQFKKMWLIISTGFKNAQIWLSNLIFNAMQGFDMVSQGLGAFGKLFMIVGRSLVNGFIVPIEKLIEKVKSLFDVIKDPTNATAWKKALTPLGLDIGKGIIDSVKKDIKDISNISTGGVKFKGLSEGLIDPNGALMQLEASRIKSNETLTNKLVDKINSQTREGGGGGAGSKLGGTVGTVADPQMSNKFAGAIEKGSVEAYKASLGARSTDKKIEKNTDKTVTELEKVNENISSIVQGVSLSLATIGV